MSDHVANFRPDWTSPPGDTIADLIEEQGWSQAEFAERTGYTTKHVNQLIAGKATISEDTAFRLERVLGSTAQFWLTREAQYRESVARTAARAALESEVSWLNEIPLAHMIKHRLIERRPDKASQVEEVLQFFGVASLEAWRKTYGNAVGSLAAFRASSRYEKKLGAVAAWLRYGERRAAEMACQPFNRAAFEAQLDAFRALTNEADPKRFVKELIDRCAQVGVAMVFAPAPPGCPVSGATKWLSPDKALLMLSLRYKSNDHLWFAFFHEAGHLLLHGKKMLFLEGLGGMDSEAEEQANKFAGDLLIPPEHARTLPYIRHTREAVCSFAEQIGIAPGIVVGRMQHYEKLMRPDYLNDLKVFYTLTD
jgi:HTH-type transcriptional regulator/antitoxin HigA